MSARKQSFAYVCKQTELHEKILFTKKKKKRGKTCNSIANQSLIKMKELVNTQFS